MPDRTINPRYIPQSVTVPANTASSAPTSTVADLGLVLLESVSIFVPTGHAGLTGIAVQLAGVHVVPYGDPTDFVLGYEGIEVFELGFQTDAGLRVITYNTDIAFAHTFYLRWKTRDINIATSSGPSSVVAPITSAPTLRNVS